MNIQKSSEGYKSKKSMDFQAQMKTIVLLFSLIQPYYNPIMWRLGNNPVATDQLSDNRSVIFKNLFFEWSCMNFEWSKGKD